MACKLADTIGLVWTAQFRLTETANFFDSQTLMSNRQRTNRNVDRPVGVTAHSTFVVLSLLMLLVGIGTYIEAPKGHLPRRVVFPEPGPPVIT
jgi:hypothetical protein